MSDLDGSDSLLVEISVQKIKKRKKEKKEIGFFVEVVEGIGLC